VGGSYSINWLYFKTSTICFYLLDIGKQLALWSRVIHEKLIVPQLVKKFLAIYLTWRFIPILTTDWHSTTSSYHESYQSILPPSNFSKIHFNSIHQSMALSSGWSHSFSLHTHTHTHTHKNCMQFSSPPYMPQAQGYHICWSKKEDFAVTVNFSKIPIPSICVWHAGIYSYKSKYTF
jgi:hypothetical protein